MTHRATYSVEDNKIRLYPDWSDEDFDKEDAKAVGFRWASKQECYVCPRWTIQAEDYCLGLVDDIEDEDYSPLERAADRAERFEGYRDKRRDEAGGLADRFESGPEVFGAQSAKRAERQAARADRLRVRSVSQWSKAEYWQQRTAGVISNALYRAKPAVRRTRIKKLESELRRHEKGVAESLRRYEAWEKVSGMEGADILLPLNESGYVEGEMNEAQRLAYTVGGDGRGTIAFFHQESEEANEKAKEVHGSYCRGFSAYDFLTRNEYIGRPFRRFTPKEYAELYLSRVSRPGIEGSRAARWSAHYENRLTYERAMLAEEGGAASDLEMEPGGFILMRGEMGRWLAEEAPNGWAQIHKVHKSRATGTVTSVEVMGVLNRHCASETKPGLVKVKVERFGTDRYRAPTEEERAAFQSKNVASKAKAPSLVNPTNEDAERLQAHWNRLAVAKKADATPTEVRYMTQKEYSYQSKSDVVGTVSVSESGQELRFSRDCKGQAVAFKVRSHYYYMSDSAAAVIVVTDKPQKSLPLDWSSIEPQAVNRAGEEEKAKREPISPSGRTAQPSLF